MANLLYVTCNVRPQDRSRTLSLGYEFLEEYLRRNPQDEVQVLDLYRDNIQRVDQDVLNVWWRIERGEDYSSHFGWRAAQDRPALSSRRSVSQVRQICLRYPQPQPLVSGRVQDVHRCDLYSRPDQPLTPLAAKSMFPDQRRKSLHLHACSPHNFGQEQELSVAYLRSVLSFLGVADHETVILEGDDPERGSEGEHETARHRLLELARRF